MQIQEFKVDNIKPYANNPRHNDDAVKAVAASIQQFGFKVPIVVDSNGVIVTGHTRLKAAKQLGLDTVPVIVADDLTDEQIIDTLSTAIAQILRDNPIMRQSQEEVYHADK